MRSQLVVQLAVRPGVVQLLQVREQARVPLLVQRVQPAEHANLA
jgi:hypothetical protein